MKINTIILFNKYFYLTYYLFSVFLMFFIYNDLYLTTIISSLFFIELFLILKFNRIISNRKPFGTFLIMFFILLSNYFSEYNQYLYFVSGIVYLATILDYKEIYLNISYINKNYKKIISNFDFIHQVNGFEIFTAIKNNIEFQYNEDFKILNIKHNKKDYDYKTILNYIQNKGIKIENLSIEDLKIIDIIDY